jgi:AcrR family transcriptional regulator
MYHHFRGKPDLALAAIRRTAEEMRATAEGVLGGPGTPYERIAAYLRRERDVLRGCPIGRLTMDPDVIASDELRAPVDETLDWLRERLAGIVEEGQRRGEFAPGLDGEEIAAAIVATVQGGYVLARASGLPSAFDAGVRGLLALLAPPTEPTA